jgi:hypothetical protein
VFLLQEYCIVICNSIIIQLLLKGKKEKRVSEWERTRETRKREGEEKLFWRRKLENRRAKGTKKIFVKNWNISIFLSTRKNSSETAMASNSNHRGTSSGIQIGSAWFQRKINLRPQHRGVHLVTEEILRQMPELGQFSVGLCHVQSKDC